MTGNIATRYNKQPNERKRYRIDYTNWLDTGESVDTVAFSVDNATTPPLVVDLVEPTPDGLGVQYYVSGGVDGQNYVVTATLTTNQGPQVKEDEILFVIKER
jgi:hypothetical protein